MQQFYFSNKWLIQNPCNTVYILQPFKLIFESYGVMIIWTYLKLFMWVQKKHVDPRWKMACMNFVLINAGKMPEIADNWLSALLWCRRRDLVNKHSRESNEIEVDLVPSISKEIKDNILFLQLFKALPES